MTIIGVEKFLGSSCSRMLRWPEASFVILFLLADGQLVNNATVEGHMFGHWKTNSVLEFNFFFRAVSDRSFLVANAQPGSCHIIYCSDGFCKMSGFSRAEVIGRPAVCEFLHGPLTSQLAVQTVKQAFTLYTEKHQQILYYRKDGKLTIGPSKRFIDGRFKGSHSIFSPHRIAGDFPECETFALFK